MSLHTSDHPLMRLAARMLHRVRDEREDQGAALLLVLMAMMIATSLSLLILGTLLSQTTGSIFDRKNARAIHAAEAGIDVALARIRAAQTRDPLQNFEYFGDRTKLPCSLSGFVQGSPGNLRYDVEIRYYQSDPALQNDAWRASTANRVACTPGAGTVLTPRFALILADGEGDGVPRLSAQAGDRRLETIYDVQLTNANIAGGIIKNFQDANAATLELCWDAGSTAAAGTRIRIQTCNEQLPQQLFAWRSDFSITLAQTQTAGSQGLCVEVPDNLTGTKYVVLEVCDGTSAQKFGFNDSAHFRATVLGIGYCPTQPSNNARGADLIATTGACGEGQIPKSAWQPSPLVGAGSVGNVGNTVDGQRFQWVNYAEFGRCFDVSNWDVGYVSMIAYPCKQIPGESVGWNQTLQWDASTKQLYTRASGSGVSSDVTWATNATRYCVTAPAASNGYVRMQTCGTNQANQRWTVNRELPGDYISSYTIVDGNGRCLSVGPKNTSAGDPGIRQWSSIVSATCNGSGQQKWNAPPDPTKPVLRDTVEVNG